MKIITFTMATLLCGCVIKNIELDYTSKELISSPFALIQIAPTFEKPIEYELTQHEPYMLLYSEYEGEGGYNWGEKVKIIRIRLTEEQHIKATELLKACITTLPLTDQAIGPDGTTWIIETTVFQYLKTMIWDPEEETESRGYSGFIELRNYLDKLVIESSK